MTTDILKKTELSALENHEGVRITAHLSITCGCGFRALDSKDASNHARQTRHVLSVHGVIGDSRKITTMRVV